MKVIVYIDGKHNTIEVKNKIKSVLPDANYMIFDHAEDRSKVTNYERIKNMSVEEMAEFLADNDDNCCFCTRQDEDVCLTPDCKYHIQQWLESEVETE